MIVKNFKAGVIETRTRKLRVKVGDHINIKIVANGVPSGFVEYNNVEVVSVYGKHSKGSLGNVGGMVRFLHNGAWHGISGNGIIDLQII